MAFQCTYTKARRAQCVTYLSRCLDKVTDKGKEGKVDFDSSWRLQSITAGKPSSKSMGLAMLFLQVGLQLKEMVLPAVTVGLPFSIHLEPHIVC